MSGRRTSFGKLERERAKKAKAAAKRENRFARSEESDADPDGAEPTTATAVAPTNTGELLEKVEKLHQRFDAGGMSFEDFEEQKNELMSRLSAG